MVSILSRIQGRHAIEKYFSPAKTLGNQWGGNLRKKEVEQNSNLSKYCSQVLAHKFPLAKRTLGAEAIGNNGDPVEECGLYSVLKWRERNGERGEVVDEESRDDIGREEGVC